jgi:hypothetical protein
MFVNNTIIPNRHLNYRNSQDGVPQIFRLKGLRLRHVKEKCQYNLDKIKMIRNPNDTYDESFFINEAPKTMFEKLNSCF